MIRIPASVHCLVHCLVLTTALRGQQHLPPSLVAPDRITLVNGTRQITVNENGVLVGHDGLSTAHGPIAALSSPVAEFFSLRFDEGGGHHDYVGIGNEPDWAARQPFTPLSFFGSGGVVTTRLGAGSVEVTCRWLFNPDGPEVLATMEVENLGATTISNVFLTREWHEPQAAGFDFPSDMGFAPMASGYLRQIWMADDLLPGARCAFAMTYSPTTLPSPSPLAVAALDLPLVPFVSPSVPTGGLNLGATNGVSFGDYNGDGWIDIFCCQSANLWVNVVGTDYILVGNLSYALPPVVSQRYGSSFGDFDNDGDPDIGTEPRVGLGDSCFHLLENLGDGPNFVDVAVDPALVIGQPCGAQSETICWGDVDFDADLDMFLPVYPPWVSGVGNFFLRNDGPAGPGGSYTLTETSGPSGLDNPPPNSARPEGAQFVDIDRDGDVDLYSNGHLYKNVSSPGTPLFTAMQPSGSGIGNSTFLDEGAVFFDYDLDSDYDLAIVYSDPNQGVKIWENEGDGTFFLTPANTVASNMTGLDLGMSAEDWDNDGDIDFSTRGVFRRNQLMETRNRLFTVATHGIPSQFLSSATPAWGDYDKDGDLDCALGNWFDFGHFYVNNTYGTSTPAADRRYFRVKTVRDAANVDRGLETEYGSSVEIFVAGEEDARRRSKFTASSNGYLNQNEYTLHFAMPSDPDPADPEVDLSFDIVADFVSDPAVGSWRVDENVNPLLGAIDFAHAPAREAVVYRSGRVRIGACDVDPQPKESPLQTTTAGGLSQPGVTTTLAAPVATSGPNRWVGLDFAVGAQATRVTEIILDGQLDAPVPGTTPFNIALWDVSTPATPVVHAEGLLRRTTSVRNHRTTIRTDWLLQPNHHYRLVARATSTRTTTVAGPLVAGGLTTFGGLSYVDADPAGGAAVVAATPMPSSIPMAIRYRAALVGVPSDLGGGFTLSPHITASQLVLAGNFQPQSQVTFDLTGSTPLSPVVVVIGSSVSCLGLFGSEIVVPTPISAFEGFMTDSLGELHFLIGWPSGFPSGSKLFVQFWTLGVDGPVGSNVVGATMP